VTTGVIRRCLVACGALQLGCKIGKPLGGLSSQPAKPPDQGGLAGWFGALQDWVGATSNPRGSRDGLVIAGERYRGRSGMQ
jgi:hypothetical protein